MDCPDSCFCHYFVVFLYVFEEVVFLQGRIPSSWTRQQPHMELLSVLVAPLAARTRWQKPKCMDKGSRPRDI
jgi:hypothetical protein